MKVASPWNSLPRRALKLEHWRLKIKFCKDQGIENCETGTEEILSQDKPEEPEGLLPLLLS